MAEFIFIEYPQQCMWLVDFIDRSVYRSLGGERCASPVIRAFMAIAFMAIAFMAIVHSHCAIIAGHLDVRSVPQYFLQAWSTLRPATVARA